MTQPAASAVLHLYSGQTDPEFALSAEEAADLRAQIGSLPGNGTPAEPPALGYRGYSVVFPDGGEATVYHETVEVRGPVVPASGARRLRDGERAVESALTACARRSLGEDLPYAWIDPPE